MAYDAAGFTKLITYCVQNSVSDVHLREGETPYIRMKGGLKKVNAEVLTFADMKSLCTIMFNNPDVMKGFEDLREYDCSYQFGTLCRVRVNYLKFQKRAALILRIITMVIPDLKK